MRHRRTAGPSRTRRPVRPDSVVDGGDQFANRHMNCRLPNTGPATNPSLLRHGHIPRRRRVTQDGAAHVTLTNSVAGPARMITLQRPSVFSRDSDGCAIYSAIPPPGRDALPSFAPG